MVWTGFSKKLWQVMVSSFLKTFDLLYVLKKLNHVLKSYFRISKVKRCFGDFVRALIFSDLVRLSNGALR